MGAFASSRAGDPERVGRYRIVGRLGAGGMGSVFLALSPGGRAVAVKVVRAELADDPGFRRRFVREVEAARRVSGFFTAAVVDADPEGAPPWLATEYVPGMSLEAAVAAHGAWPAPTVLALGAALAEALESVHAAGVVHRDLKPSNVLLAADGPRVIDFGIARAAESTELTETGMVIGTPGFISPEQLVDDEVSAAGDVFALGAVLAYAATGAGPFGTGPAHALHYRVVHEEPDLSGLPPATADVVARCLAKDPGRRPTVPELVEELSRASGTGREPGFFTEAGWLPGPVAAEVVRLRATPLLAPPEAPVPPPPPLAGPPERTPPPPGRARRRILAGLAAAAVLALVAVAVVVTGLLSGGDRKDASGGPPERKKLWSFELGEGMHMGMAVGGRVLVDNGKGFVSALDARTGRRLWQREFAPGEKVLTSPGVTGASERTVYFGAGRHTYALAAGSGQELWKTEDQGLHTEYAEAGDKIYTTVPVLLAFDSRTGRKLWRHDYDGISLDRPIVAGGVVYVVNRDGTLFAVDAETGDALWDLQVGDKVESAPVPAGGTVYFAGRDGALYAVNSATGRKAWTQRFDGGLWDPSLAEGASSPIVADGVVYFENDAYVCAFDAETGTPLWRHKPAMEEVHLTAVRDGELLFDDGDDSGNLYALDIRTGERLWKEHLGGSPTIVDDTLYYEWDGTLYALSAAG